MVFAALTGPHLLNSPYFWAWALATLGTALVVGFAAGCVWTTWREATTLWRAKARIESLCKLLETRLQSAILTCNAVQNFSPWKPAPEQTQRFRQQSTALVGLLQQLQQRLPDEAPPVPEIVAFDPLKIRWTKKPLDPLTQLPDRACCDKNLDLLLGLSKKARLPCGVLLVRMDRLDTLQSRLGPTEADHLRKKFANVTCQSAREGDLICQFSADTLAVLMPQITPTTGPEVAEQIRRTLRSYRFRSLVGETEVLVTASLGYTLCGFDDRAGLALSRAADALARSQRLGRNQLHMHDGRSVLLIGN